MEQAEGGKSPQKMGGQIPKEKGEKSPPKKEVEKKKEKSVSPPDWTTIRKDENPKETYPRKVRKEAYRKFKNLEMKDDGKKKK